MLTGTIIENSLVDTSIVSKLTITRTWYDDDWLLHDVLVDEAVAEGLGIYLKDGPWYMHFYAGDSVLVVFKDRIFHIRHSQKETWNEALAYGRTLGIPEEQLDFQIE